MAPSLPVRGSLLVGLVAVLVALTQHLAPFPTLDAGAVLVTGTSSGIGRDAVLSLAALNRTHVFATVRKESDADDLRREAAARGVADSLEPLIMEVTDEDSIAHAVQVVEARLKELDMPLAGVVNNAGIGYRANLGDIDLQKARRVFDVNVFGVIAVSQAFLPLLTEGSRIVNIGSMSGLIALAGWVPYSTTKFAVEAMSDSWRRELEPRGISVSLIEPGFVASSLCDRPGTCVGQANETTTPAIVHALKASRPKARYAVASVKIMPAWVFQYLPDVLPDRVLDWFIQATWTQEN